jgi:hypothetical protein
VHQHIVRGRALAACVTLLFTAMGTTPATRGAAMIATFEGYAEGTSFQPSLLDAPSGIHFVNPTGATNGNFIIEHANQAGPLLVQNNKYLNTSGVAPGNSASFAYQFGFTGVLPQPAKVVELDAIYAGAGTPGSITLTAFNGSDAAVGTSVVTVSDAALRQAHLKVESPFVDIARFTLTASNVSVGYDNVAFPEPVAGVALLLLPLRRRR